MISRHYYTVSVVRTRTEALSVRFPLGRIAPLYLVIAHDRNIIVRYLLLLCSLFHPLHTYELGVRSGISKSESLWKTTAEF